MKKVLRNIGLTALVCLALAGCSGRKVVEIRVVSTTDVHGYVFDKDILTGRRKRHAHIS